MTNLFPGMDPFLETPAYWSDFHATFINYWREAIADALPPAYEASLGEHVYLVQHDPAQRKLGVPDVAVAKSLHPFPADRASGGAAAATLEPVTIPLTILEGPRETYIEILHGPERSLVAALELLSPGNKENPGRTEYLAKRRAFLHQNVHLVELDLMRGGRRLPMEKTLPPGDYHYLVSRAEQRPDCQVYSWTLREPLPTLPVPLRAPDADIFVDLAKVFATAFERARFARRLDYRKECPPPLRDGDREWVAAQMAKR